MKTPLPPDEAVRTEAPRDRVAREAPPSDSGPARPDGAPGAAAGALPSRFSSLRVRLLLIVLLAIIPALGLTFYNGWEQRRIATRIAHGEALWRARYLAEEFEGVIDEGRHLLTVLSHLPDVRAGTGAACGARLAALVTAYPHYVGLAATRADGTVFCASRPDAVGLSVADRPYFRRALETREFTVGEYQIGRVSGKAVLPLAQPLLDDSGRARGVVFAPLDLAWFNRFAARTQFPEGASLTVIDSTGTIVGRHPDPDKWVGRPLADHPAARAVSAQQEGMGEGVGADGVARLYAFTTLGDAAGARLAVGLRRDLVFREADWILRRNLIVLGIAGLAMLAIAWVASDALILRRVKRLLGATHGLTAGDLEARVGQPYGRGELGDLALAFDEMATALARHTAALTDAEARSRSLHGEARQRLRETETLLAVSESLGSTTDLMETMRRIAREAGRLFRADMVGAYVPTPDGTALRALAGYHVPKALLDSFGEYRIPLKGHPILVQAWEEQRPVFSSDVPVDPRVDRGAVARFPHQSLLVVPLIDGGELLGVLGAVWWTERRVLTTDELRLADGIGRQATLAVAGARLFDEAERRRKTAQTLAEVGRWISGSLDLEDVAQRIAEGVRTLVGAQHAVFYRLDPDTMDLVLLALAGDAGPAIGPGLVICRGVGVVGLAVGERRMVATPDVLADPRITLTTDLRARIEQAPSRSVLAVPLLVRGTVVGVFSVGDAAGRVFGDHEVAVMQAFADQAAIALENARLYADATRRQREAEGLARVARSLTESLEASTVGERIVESVLPLFGARSAALRLLQPDGSLVGVAWGGSDRDVFKPGHLMPPGVGVVGRAVAEGQPAWSRDVLTDPAFVLTDELRALNARGGVRAVLAVPLRAKGTIIGALSVGDRAARDFSQAEVALLRAFADQAALALENARHHEEVERRRREAEVLADLSRQIGASLDLHTVLQRLTDGARDLCHADLAEIALWEPDVNAMVYRYWAGVDSEAYRAIRVEPGKGVGGHVILSGRPCRTDDYLQDPRVTKDYREPVQEEGIVSLLSAPILMGDRVEGLLGVANRSGCRFTDENEAILVKLADHAAIAIQNARLYEQAEQRRKAAESLAEVGRLVSQSLDSREVARRIADSVLRLLNGVTSAIFELDPASGSLVSLALSGEMDRIFQGSLTLPPGAGAAGLAVREKRAVVTADFLGDPRISLPPAIRERIAQEGPHRALLAVPLAVKGRTIGALGVADGAGRVFTEDDVRLAQAFADQAAVALENARLFQNQVRLLEDTQRQHEEASALEVVGREITSSLERQEVLQRIVDRARALCGCDIAYLAPYDPETGTAAIVAASGARSLALFEVAISRGQGIGGKVLEAGEAFVTEDYLNDPRISRDYADSARAEGTVAEAVIPLRLKGEITGLLGVINRTPRSFAPRDLSLLSRLADQAAIALENSRLYADRSRVEAELRTRARQETAVAALSQHALGPISLDVLLDETVRLVARTLDAEYCKVLQLLPGSDTLLLRAGVGWKDGYVGRATVGTDIGSQAGHTLRCDAPVTVEDLRTERRFTGAPLLLEHGVVSGLSVVIRGQARPFGVLGAHTSRHRRFTDDDSRFLQSVANVLATAIERTRAEETLRQHHERLRTLCEIDQAIVAARSSEAIAQAALRRIREGIPCRRASVVLFDFQAREVTALAVDTSGPSGVPAGTRVPLTDYPADIEQMRAGTVLVNEDLASIAAPSPVLRILRAEGIRSSIAVPLLSQGTLIGALNLSADVPSGFTPEQIEIAREVADSLAVAIQDARLFEQVREGRERLQTLSRRLVEVQEAERRHLARELHDEIGQILTGLKLSLEMSARAAAATPAGALDEAQKLVQDLITRVRELSLDLRPAMLDDLGLLPTLLWHFERYATQTDVRVEFEHGGLERRFPAEIETAAYRIVQEGLTNVARHAGVREVTVWVWAYDATLNVRIEDRGRGFDLPSAATMGGGLSGMRERATLLGGLVDIASVPGDGTRITAELPLESPAERRQRTP